MLAVCLPSQHHPLSPTPMPRPPGSFLHNNNNNKRRTVSNQLRCPNKNVKEGRTFVDTNTLTCPLPCHLTPPSPSSTPHTTQALTSPTPPLYLGHLRRLPHHACPRFHCARPLPTHAALPAFPASTLSASRLVYSSIQPCRHSTALAGAWRW